jgi:hypothetical protein
LLRRCSKYVAALAACATTLWVAGPALSTTPYLPEASDFTQPLPELERLDRSQARAAEREPHGSEHPGHADEGPVRFLSPHIKAPKRFDLVGVAGYEGEVEFRVRDAGGAWSEWVAVGSGDPLYTGGSDEVQVRSREGRPQGELHYVNVSGDTTPLNGVLSKVRRSINSAVVTSFGGRAEAASPRPQFVSRREWGANRAQGGCKPRSKPAYGKVKAAIVHHTVSLNNYSEAAAPGIVLGICRYHRNANGWSDIGYNALVDRFGNLYQGRAGGMGKPVIGAHAEGHNSQTVGIAAIANHSQARPRPAEKQGLVRYLAWRLDRAKIRATGKTSLKSAGGATTRTPAGKRIRVRRVSGHQDTNNTACPGDYLYPQLGKIKRRVQKRMNRFAEEPPPDGGSDPGGVVPRSGGISPG